MIGNYNLSNLNQFISVTDDEADLAYLFEEALGTIEGVDVFAFTDPILALEHFKINYRNYKCVISDFRMPSMTGVQYLDQVKQISPYVKRILVSAFDRHDDLFEDCQCIDAFLSKPVKMADLIKEVQQQVKKVETGNVS
jgi:DNA-binding NtrC family response regulator